jgi:hypothetical protein
LFRKNITGISVKALIYKRFFPGVIFVAQMLLWLK